MRMASSAVLFVLAYLGSFGPGLHGWPILGVTAARAQISVTSARIGCLDIQTEGNLTAIVARACNGKWECSFKAPTEAQYKAEGVKARTRPLCTQGMEIAYSCGHEMVQTVDVPGDAWNHPPAQLDCRSSANYNAKPGVITITDARIGCLDIQTEPNLTVQVAGACDGKVRCAYEAPSEEQYTRMGVHAETRPLCTQGMVIDYECGRKDFNTVTVPGDAWRHPPAQLDCTAPPSPLKGRFDPTGPTLAVVTLGDSIMWGQGVPQQSKFSQMVTDWLQSQLPQRRVTLARTHAHSGAVTGFGAYPSETKGKDPDGYYAAHTAGYPYPGEVPFSYPSISHQIALTLADLPQQGLTAAQVALVLLDGGINDVSVQNILNVSDVSTNAGWVAKLAQSECVDHMKALLPQVLAAFPNAYVVITGYYQIVSEGTDPVLLAKYLAPLEITVTAAGVPLGVGADVAIDLVTKKQLIERSKAFADVSRQGFEALANQVNASMKSPRVAVAIPAFSDQNAYGGGITYLWRVGQFAEDEGRGYESSNPQADVRTPGGVATMRAHECRVVARTDSPKCLDASMGHPNLLGARAYATAVIGQILPLVGGQ